VSSLDDRVANDHYSLERRVKALEKQVSLLMRLAEAPYDGTVWSASQARGYDKS